MKQRHKINNFLNGARSTLANNNPILISQLNLLVAVTQFFSSPQSQSQGYPFAVLHTIFLASPINKSSPQFLFSGPLLTEFDPIIKHSSLLPYLFPKCRLKNTNSPFFTWDGILWTIHSWSFCIRSKIFFTHHPLCYIRIDKKGNKFHSLNGFHNLKRKGGDMEIREGKETLTTNSSVAHNHSQLMMKVNILFLQTSRRNWTVLMLFTDLIDKFLYKDRKQWEEAGFFTLSSYN